jgi:putative transcriptional regulator
MSKRYRYTASGLDWVYLANGFHVENTAYGRGIVIENVDDLHDAIARTIIGSPRAIRGQEVRFLRAALDLSQSHLARMLGVKPLAVKRWEAARSKGLPGTADRALRLLYAGKMGDRRLVQRVIELLSELDEIENTPQVFSETAQGWERKAA